ncbi:M48 family metallopeptidase [Actinomadura harenae]|uniref:Zn-dependent protease n=1 Tax=Actinomadura harenae TaxID=2483351 RepID=A0A3M2MBV6_9ACTN|nr:M48 family metallopeptidase [Actinomadura harenae]RMI47087.1 Zn-dependent protease [Actinomadura harenae]
MTTTLRAILALTLLAGFYLLVGLILAVAVAADALYLTHPSHLAALKGVIVLTVAALALLRALFMVGRKKDGDDAYGRIVSPQEEPELWQEVTALAGAVGTAPPDEIRLVPDVNAAVMEETSWLGLRARHRRMFIGLPLLGLLSRSELASVLGHELGHYSGSHTRLGQPTYRGRVALIRTVGGLGNHPFVQRLFVWYAKLYFRISEAVSRRQELEADEFAVKIAGRRAASEALTKVHIAGAAWGAYGSEYLPLIGPAKARPTELYGGLRHLLNGQRERFLNEANSAETSPYDSHPSLPDRLAAISRLPESPVHVDGRPAATVLRDPAGAERAIEADLWSDEARALPAVPWEELAARALYNGANAEAVSDLLVAAQRINGAPEPTLGGAFAAVAAGRIGELAAGLRDLGWQGNGDDPALVENVLVRAVQGVLVETRRARWILSWEGPITLRDASGAEVEVKDAVSHVIANPAASGELRALLERYGVPAEHRPALLAAQAQGPYRQAPHPQGPYPATQQGPYPQGPPR